MVFIMMSVYIRFCRFNDVYTTETGAALYILRWRWEVTKSNDLFLKLDLSINKSGTLPASTDTSGVSVQYPFAMPVGHAAEFKCLHYAETR